MSDKLELPRGWSFCSLEKLCKLNPRHPKDTAGTLTVSFVPMAAVDDTTGQIVDRIERPYGEVRRGYTQFADGDVLFAKITPCMENGKAAVAHGLKNGLGCGTTEFFVLRTRGAIEPALLHRYLRQFSFRQFAKTSMNSAVGQARVPKSFILEAKLPVPPLNEQRRIVAKIEELTTRSRASKQALDAIPPLLERLRQSVLAAAFRGDLTKQWRQQNPNTEPAIELLKRIRQEHRHRWEQDYLEKQKAKGKEPKNDKWKEKYKEPGPVDTTDLPELPEGWCWAATDLVCETIVDCPHSTPRYRDDGPLLVRTSDFRVGELCLSSTRRVSQEDFEKRTSRLKPLAGDILYSREGGILGIACVIPRGVEICMGQRMMLLRTSRQFLRSRVLMWVLNSPIVLRQVAEQLVGTAAPRINVSAVKKFAVPVPPLNEQEIIHSRINVALSSIANTRMSVEQTTDRVASLDQSILAKAFRGELVPQDPNDEPASELLNRIEVSKGKKKIRGRVVTRYSTIQKESREVKKSVVETLRYLNKPVTPEELFRETGCEQDDIELFYAQIRDAILDGLISQDPQHPNPEEASVLLRLKR
jgi:type I restriction enzyme S subunit